jgi:AcrR family transcriptional regulator
MIRAVRAQSRKKPQGQLRRGPGRPARLSREAIVRAALTLLERSPGEPLTVSRIAAEVEAAPAALYRHFAQLDELLDAVLREVLGAVAFEIRPRSSAAGQVRAWMTSVREHLLRYPAVLPLLGRQGRTSPAWLDAVSVLIGILERAGLSGADLALAQLWIAETTMGVVILEASLPLRDQIANARASLDEMSEAGRERMESVVPHLAKLGPDAFFSFATDRAVDALLKLARPS